MPEDNGNENPNESYNSKYQKHVACSYGYKLVCVYDKFSKPLKSYLGKDAVCNSVSSMIEESEYCTDVMKKHFSKKLVMTKKYYEDFEDSTKYWICDNDYIDDDVKVIDHCHITEKYRPFANRNCIITFKLNHKIPVVFTT